MPDKTFDILRVQLDENTVIRAYIESSGFEVLYRLEFAKPITMDYGDRSTRDTSFTRLNPGDVRTLLAMREHAMPSETARQ